MYNGIGLRTVRGSGTNGYVQRNLSALRPSQSRPQQYGQMEFVPPEPKKANKEILEHNRKRQVEVQVFQLREDMEDRGHTAAEIEKQTSKLRKRLEREAESSINRTDRPTETHEIAERKEEEIRRLRNAFGLGDSFVPGEAFDQDLQEQRKIERMKAYELRARQERKAARADKRSAKKQRKKEKRRLKKEKKERKKAAKRQKRELKAHDQDSGDSGSKNSPKSSKTEKQKLKADDSDKSSRKSPRASARRKSPSASGSGSSSSSSSSDGE